MRAKLDAVNYLKRHKMTTNELPSVEVHRGHASVLAVALFLPFSTNQQFLE